MNARPTARSSRALLQRLKNRQLLLLLELAEAGSLRKAASALNLAQPAATKLLRDLEEALGLALFDRRRSGLRPNAYGEVMIRHARAMVAEVEHARQELAAVAAGGTGRIRVGAVLSAIPFFIARAVARLKREQPGLVVSVEVDTSNVLLPALAQGDLDVVVARPSDTTAETEFGYRQLIDEPLVVAARTQHPLLAAERLDFKDLAGFPWALLPPESPMRRVLTPLFREIGIERPADLVETSSMLMITTLLQETDTLAVLPEDVVRYHAERNLLARIPVTLPPIMGAYGILLRRDRTPSPGIAAFLESLRAVLDTPTA